MKEKLLTFSRAKAVSCRREGDKNQHTPSIDIGDLMEVLNYLSGTDSEAPPRSRHPPAPQERIVSFGPLSGRFESSKGENGRGGPRLAPRMHCSIALR